MSVRVETGADEADPAPVTLRLSRDAARILAEAGGIVLEIGGRSGASTSPPAADTEPDPADPLVAFLNFHPLGATSANDQAHALILQCDALEHFGVPLGTKSIAIWMWRRWTPAITRRHGAARAAATLRRWRITHPRWTAFGARPSGAEPRGPNTDRSRSAAPVRTQQEENEHGDEA